MPVSLSTFNYPLTCCSLGPLQQDWSKLPVDKLQSAAECAIGGLRVYEKGCYNKLVEFLDSTRTWVIVVAVAVLLIEVRICYQLSTVHRRALDC